ncbi:MAG: hypothetical protein BIFFINMI_01539 [Phycisphaerae bacterium]|nr:hypothetical protein [Phycisphaerae bacterium]
MEIAGARLDRPHFTPAMWGVLMLALAGLLAWGAMLIYPNEYDSCVFMWMGGRMLHGDLPYRDLWDNKLPTIYWINALAAATGRQAIALWAMQSVAVAAGGWMIFGIARRAWGDLPGGLAGVGYVTLATPFNTLGTGNFTETWAAPFAILSAWAMIRYCCTGRRSVAWALLSGVGLGAVATLRPPGLIVGAVLLAMLPSLRRRGRLRVRAVAAWLAGFLAMPAANAAWAAAHGILHAMVADCLLFNVAHATSGDTNWGAWAHVGRRLVEIAQTTWPWHLLAAAGLTAVLIRGRQDQPPQAAAPGPGGTIRVAAVVWLVAGVASAVPGMRLYYHHYYLALAPLAMLSAPLAAFFSGPGGQGRPARQLQLRLLGGAIVLLFAALIGRHFLGNFNSARWARQSRSQFNVDRVGDWLDAHAAPDATVMVLGWGRQTQLLPRLDRPSGTKHVMVTIYPDLPGGREMVDEWIADLRSRPPDWLVCYASTGDGGNWDLVAGTDIRDWNWAPGDVALLVPVHEVLARDYTPAIRFGSLRIYRRAPDLGTTRPGGAGT